MQSKDDNKYIKKSVLIYQRQMYCCFSNGQVCFTFMKEHGFFCLNDFKRGKPISSLEGNC